MKYIVMIWLCFLLALTIAAQQGPPVTPPPEEMAELAQLAGDWEGEGWAMVPGSREEFRQTEDVELLINGHALIIKGHGVDAETSEVVHDAIALISWDEEAEAFRVQAMRANGSYVEASARLEAESFIWGYETPRGTVRFTIDLSDPDRWQEIGEFSVDGESWMKFLEMNLTKR